MAGFFGLFGGNKQSTESKEPFFLSEDDAKSFGDIDFMRKEVVVRRTFAKKKGMEEEMESVRSISSSNKKNLDNGFKPATSSFGTPATPTFETPSKPAAKPSTSAGQSSDSGMDMFRNMAKKMRK